MMTVPPGPALVAAASLVLRDAEPGAALVWEPVDGPRFPHGAVADPDLDASTDRPVAGPVRARRWWDPTCPVGGLDPSRVASFLAIAEPQRLPAAPEECVGWGPGLTPAGDDVVVGMLIGHRAAGRPGRAAHLAHAVAAADTAPLSRALLDHAAGGRAVGPLLDLVRALGGRGSLPDAVAALERFGATSGRHLLDGLRRALVEAGATVDSGRCGTSSHISGDHSTDAPPRPVAVR